MKIYRILCWLLLVFTISLSLFLASFQWRGQFADGTYESLSPLAARLTANDLVLAPKNTIIASEELIPSLRYYFGINVFKVSWINEIVGEHYEEFIEFFALYDDVLVVSHRPLDDSGLPLVLRVILPYEKGYFPPSNFIPKKFVYHREKIYLYELDIQAFSKLDRQTFDQPTVFSVRDPGLSVTGFTKGRDWTTGCATLDLNTDIQEGSRTLSLHLNGWRPHWRNLKNIQPTVRIDGVNLEIVSTIEKGYIFNLEEVERITQLELCSTTFQPSATGGNGDSRTLGLDVKKIEIQ